MSHIATHATTIAIIDGAIANPQSLIDGLSPDTQVLVLDSTQDGISQITNALQGLTGLESLQIFSHGAAGSLQLGSSQLNADTLTRYATQLNQWSTALTDRADILLYGCNVGSSATKGNDFLNRMSQLTGADIAASTNLTGNGGDWNLEVATGRIEAAAALSAQAMTAYSGTLNSLTVTTVADSGTGSLRWAIATATAGSTIRFASNLADQTITLNSGLTVDAGKNIIIDGTGVSNLTISGNNRSRILLVNSNQDRPTTVTVKNLAMVNGYTSDRGGAISTTHRAVLNIDGVSFRNNVADKGGGAIFSAFEGTVTVDRSFFGSNRATAGNDERGAGAIAFWGPRSLTVRNSTFTANRGINGGAINSLNGKLTIENSQFLNNDTTSARVDQGQPNESLRGYGGAIYADRASSTNEPSGTIRITGSRFEGNKGLAEGGAAYLYTGKQDNVVISGSLFKDNQVNPLPNGNAGNGGGLVVLSNELNRGLTIQNSAFVNNSATNQGGGLWMMKAPTTIVNTTFSANRATGTSYDKLGGGMVLLGPATITNSTIAFNSAGWVGGGIHAGTDPVTVRNSIFFNNTAANGGNDWKIRQQTSRELTNGGGNIQFPSFLSNQSNRFNDNLATGGIRIADPRLGALQTSGSSFLPFHPLLATSPAINTGVSAGAPTTDQLGMQRVNGVDVGAFEFDGTISSPPTANVILGTAGNDLLSGTTNRDRISAEAGNDWLTGGLGADVLTGGGGADRFVYQGNSKRAAFAASRLSAPDQITDFSTGEGDRIQLDYDLNLATVNRPTGLFYAGAVVGSTLGAAIATAYADKNRKKAGKQALAANEAIFLTWKNRTYLAVNDTAGGFNSNRDMVINLTNTTIPLAHKSSGMLPITSYFV